MAECKVCFRHCNIKEGAAGFCGARSCKDGVVYASNYGKITSLALDPIEKKPLAEFYPGSMILSIGSYGCNLRCPFCQNYSISWSEEAFLYADNKEAEEHIVSPEDLAEMAFTARDRGNIGIAFTYNEPLIGYEFVRDTAKISHEMGMKNVLVTNGTASPSVLEEVAPYIDAMNIDLKGFSEHFYKVVVDGSFEMVKAFICRAVQLCHVELTMLIIPGENDREDEMRELSCWIADLKDEDGAPVGKGIPLHISRFFPRFLMTDRRATSVSKIYRLAEVAREALNSVYTGNC